MKDKCTYCAVQEIRETLKSHETLTFYKAENYDKSKMGMDVYKHPKVVKQPWDVEGTSYYITWIPEWPDKCRCP